MAFVNGLSSSYDLHGPTSEKNSFESLGPLTTCKSNMDQIERPFSKKWGCWFFEYIHKKGSYTKRGNLKKINFDHSLGSNRFILTSLLFFCLYSL